MTDDRKRSLDLRAVVLLLGCCAVWGLGQVAAKVTLTEIPPLTQSALRSAGATLLLLAWMRWRGIGLDFSGATRRGGLLAGGLFAAEFACIYVGLQYTAASRMTVFIYLAPFFVALGMPFIQRSERLGAWQVLGLVGAFAAVAWAFAEGFARPAQGDKQWLGDALGLAAALFWAGSTLAVRGTALTRALPETTLLYQLAISAAALGAAAVAVGEPWPQQLTGRSLWPLAFQTVVITFVSYLVWFWLMRHYPATRIASFTLLTPLLGLLAGVLLLGDPLTLRIVVALAAVCLGIVLVNRAAAPAVKPSIASRESA